LAEFPGPTVFADWSPDGTQVLVLGASGDQRFLVGDAGEVEFEREPLLVPVGPLDVDVVDAVQRLLAPAG